MGSVAGDLTVGLRWAPDRFVKQHNSVGYLLRDQRTQPVDGQMLLELQARSWRESSFLSFQYHKDEAFWDVRLASARACADRLGVCFASMDAVEVSQGELCIIDVNTFTYEALQPDMRGILAQRLAQQLPRVNANAVSVRLGGLGGQRQAQLDGFKSRALRSTRAPAQRHLYLTEWRSVDVAEARVGATLVIGDVSSLAKCKWLSACASPHELSATAVGGAWAAIATVVATQRGSLVRLPLSALEVALALVQTQVTTTVMPEVWLLLMGYPSHSGTWGLGRSARAEALVPLVCLHTPVTTALTCGILPLTEPEAVLHASAPCVPRLEMAANSFDGLVRLHFHARGAISNLFVEPQPALRPLGDAEVHLRVRA
ncbi:hypothetical protein OAO87_02340, partial [bacterium]|nr:hypothetical protein [bacterium]